MDTDKEVIAIKLYDDRGFYEYVIERWLFLLMTVGAILFDGKPVPDRAKLH